ncbi:MAG TPA: ribonuclease R [Phycisphaerae bacterium]|nr:ribonuclease R [Phycisphaerae bacterium]
MREKILTHLRSHHYHPMKLRRLARFFDVAEEDYGEFRTLVKTMVRDGEIDVSPRGKLVAPREERPEAEAPKPPPARPRKAGVAGRFSLSQRGFGFVTPAADDGPTGGDDLYIGPEDTLGAVTNDQVVAEVRGKSPRGWFGRILEITERGQTRFVGTYLETPTGGIVRPDGGILLQDFAVPDATSAGARPKDKVVFEVLKYALRSEPGEAVITKVLGPRGAPGVDTLSVIHQFSLPHEFAEDVLDVARRAADRLDDAALGDRRDLTGDIILTIDPVDARDFDDAVSLKEDPDGTFTLGVHIADVAHFVRPGEPLDEEARLRGTSVYLPTAVVPMLPEVLSNGVCSLQEGRTRLTKSAFIRFDRDGEPRDVELANTFIRSRKRLTYEQASGALEGKADGLESWVVDLLKAMERLARVLLDRRRRLGYLELDLPEVNLEFNDDGCVVAAHPEDTSFSHRIIEMFMVEANEAVARELDKYDQPYLRRIHPEPDDEAAEDLMHYAKSVGYPLHNPRDRRDLQQLLNAVRGKPEAYGIHLAVLRSLKRAEYSIKKENHFALGSEAYCHFTSPIRRYPDLTIHRLFDAVVRGQVEKPTGGRHKAKAGPPTDDGATAELAAHCSRTERRAEAAERELTKIKLLEFLEHRIGDTFTGIITGVQQFGVFVENPKLLIDGLVHISNLKDDSYQFDRRRWILVGRRTGRVLRVGSPLEVRIAAINIPRRQLDLEPIEPAAAAKPVHETKKAVRQEKKSARKEKWTKRAAAPHKKSRGRKKRR